MPVSDESLATITSQLTRPVEARELSAGHPMLTTVLEPRSGWSSLQLRELWEYRELLYFMSWRDLRARYRQMALGPLWIVVQPLASMLIYSVIFGAVAKLPSDGVPYPLFSYVGLLPWTFFSGAISSASGSLLGSKALIEKVYFPRLLIPISQILSSLVDFAISFVILLGMLVYYGVRPNIGVAMIPVFLLVATVTGLGVGLWFAGVIVKYRDFGQVVGYLVRVWMYASPVVYSISLIPKEWRTLYFLNPITGVVEGFRWALLGTGAPPDWTLAASSLIATLLFISSLFVFKRSERNIVDVA